MELFEFLMILLSIIVGFGLAEILTGIARMLRDGREAEFTWVHSAVVITIFLALLQTFWESWGLQDEDTWTFPAMLLMLATPIFLFTIANVLFPSGRDFANLGEYYFARAKLIWGLALLAVIVGVSFRPLAFDLPLFVADNASTIPTALTCVLLMTSRNRKLHYLLVPLAPITVAADTLVINYLIR
jgi:hypothetical protein